MPDCSTTLRTALNGTPLESGRFLLLAINITTALDRIHAAHRIHRHLSPVTIMVQHDDSITLRDSGGHDRRSATPDELFRALLPYISPEQTGRLSRLVDSRSDLYSLGAIFYEMLTGVPPFQADDSLEWAHCHIARQAKSPTELHPAIPVMVSRIVMKLLAKSPDERYQTARGLQHDLTRCRDSWQQEQVIHQFPLAEQDLVDRLLIPQRLYGRDEYRTLLLTQFQRAGNGEGPLLLLVNGYSGIGKSSLVRELYGPAVNAGGRFLSGKFDQYKQDIPYATIAEAFREPIRQILTEETEVIEAWRIRLQEALGINGRLITELIPEVELIIGQQPAAQELPPSDALQRFATVFQRFSALFAKTGSPLVLFLDDLQWVDPASLRLLEYLALSRELPTLLLIGAYRDNEVDPVHPLALALDKIAKNNTAMTTITLSPLSLADLHHFLSDIVSGDTPDLQPLTRLIHEKTGGNPFFMIQFLLALHEDNLLRFNRETGAWQWDTSGIIAKEYTSNVVELMAGRLGRLSGNAQQALRYAACIGNCFEQGTVETVSELPASQIHDALAEALQNGLLLHFAAESYCFLHDRIQQAAYSLIEEEQRPALHLRIGRLLLRQTSSTEAGSWLFDMVNQFNQGIGLIHDPLERATVARLNLEAGRRAKASTAYGSARSYLATGVALCDSQTWSSDHDLIFSLNRELAEAEYLNCNYPRSQELLLMLVEHAPTAPGKAQLYNTLIIQHTLTGAYGDAIATGRAALQLLDVHLPTANLEHEFEAALARYRKLLGTRPILTLADEPEMSDLTMRIALELLSNMAVPARYTNSTLFALVSITNVNISLQYGPTAKSTVGYTTFGMVLNTAMDAFQDAYDFGQVGLRLSERFNAMPQKCQSSFMIGHYLNQWVRHLKYADETLEDGIRAGLASGEVQWTGYSMAYQPFQPLYRGVALESLRREIPKLLYFTRKTANQWGSDTLAGLQLTLDQLCSDPSADNQQLDDDGAAQRERFVASCRQGKSFGALGRYAVVQVQIHYLFGQLEQARQALELAQECAGFFSSSISVAAFNFYQSMVLLAFCEGASHETRCSHLATVAANQQQMARWVASCPDNFLHLQLLVQAETARINGDWPAAALLYEQSIQAARQNGFVQDEALALERASLCYRQQRLLTVADGLLQQAIDCYLRWGVTRKARMLEQQLSWLTSPSQGHNDPLASLDTVSVIKATQAISSEIRLDTLLQTIMTIVLEQAGAQRGILLLTRNEQVQVTALATAGADGIRVSIPEQQTSEGLLPLSVINYVRRTLEQVISDDSNHQQLFSNDPYLKSRNVLSLLCLPLLHQSKLIGLLYLENDLVSGAFTVSRISLLQILAAQAAISLEYAVLYQDQLRMEAQARGQLLFLERLMETIPLPVFYKDGNGIYTGCNAAFCAIMGRNKQELVGHTVFDVAPANLALIYHEADLSLMRQGGTQVYETQTRDAEGALHDVIFHKAVFSDADGAPSGLIGVINDITGHKQAEAERLKLEQQLLHAQKLESLGVLAGGIAHDFNNILAAIIGNADLALMKLSPESPVITNLHRIEQAAARAADLAKQMLAYSGKGKFVIEQLSLNRLLEEMLHMLEVSISKKAVLRLNLTNSLPSVAADATQLRQIIMNLVINASEAIGDRSGVIAISTGCMDCDHNYLKDVWLNENLTDGLYVYLEIADTGCGMSRETQVKLFDPFFTTKFTGRGLGMAAVLGIVRGHKGAIRVYSELDKGTTFKILLPASDRPAALFNGHNLSDDWKGSGTVLLVDDEETVRGIGAEMLNMLGFSVITAVDGRDALEKFKNDPTISFVILDLTMPRLDGEQCFRELRMLRPDIRVIISSGYNEHEVTQQFAGKGLAGFIQKPYKLSVLKEAIRGMESL